MKKQFFKRHKAFILDLIKRHKAFILDLIKRQKVQLDFTLEHLQSQLINLNHIDQMH
jgi:hypothetical protein